MSSRILLAIPSRQLLACDENGACRLKGRDALRWGRPGLVRRRAPPSVLLLRGRREDPRGRRGRLGQGTRATVERGIFNATETPRIVRPARGSPAIRRMSAAVRRGGRPQDRPSAARRSRAALIRSLIASRSILAAQAITASTTSAAGPSRSKTVRYRDQLAALRPPFGDVWIHHDRDHVGLARQGL